MKLFRILIPVPDIDRAAEALRPPGNDDAVLRCVQKLITSLNPRPGADFSSDETRYVVSDVIVKKAPDGGWLSGKSTSDAESGTPGRWKAANARL